MSFAPLRTAMAFPDSPSLPDIATRTERITRSIPLLRSEEMSADLEAIRTWQEALSDALADEIPHDLFALWLFPPAGGPVLVGPEALAEDKLVIPQPKPRLEPRQLEVLEEIVRDAGYRSAKCLAVPHGQTDVGLLLLGNLQPNQYGDLQVAMLDAAIRAIAPMLGRLVRRWPPGEADTEAPPAIVERRGLGRNRGDAGRLDALLAGLGQACTGAGTPRDFLLAVSYALQGLLPHDIIELLVPDTTGEHHYRLGSHGFGPLWSDEALIVTDEHFDPARVFGDSATLLLDDAGATGGGLDLLQGGAGYARSIIGVRLRVLERTVGYLLLGNLGEDFYEREDLELLDHVGALLTARVDSFVLRWHQQVLRTSLGTLQSLPAQLRKTADALASAPLLAEGTMMFARQISGLFPVKRIEFAVRLGDETRVAIIQPGEARPLADLPQVPIGGTLVADVLRGQTAFILTEQDLGAGVESVLVVPLRAGGSTFGALALTGVAETFSKEDVSLTQHLADLIAPHFEILRRSLIHHPPFTPGWKRAPRF